MALENSGSEREKEINSFPSKEEKMKKEFKSVLQDMKDNEKENIITNIKYLDKLIQIQQDCIRDGLYDGDLKDFIEAAIKEKVDQYEESKSDFYKIHALQNRVDAEVGTDVLEEENVLIT